MTKTTFFAAAGLIFVGAGVGATSGYLVGTNHMDDFGSHVGQIIRNICGNEGYDGAIYQIEDISTARCLNHDDLDAFLSDE